MRKNVYSRVLFQQELSGRDEWLLTLNEVKHKSRLRTSALESLKFGAFARGIKAINI